MTGSGLSSAAAQLGQMGNSWIVNFTLNDQGAALFGPFTASHIGRPLAIVLDGIVLSAPTINAALTDGGMIEGSFTQDEAQNLALQLRYGALPVPLRVESTESVGSDPGPGFRREEPARRHYRRDHGAGVHVDLLPGPRHCGRRWRC